MGAVYRGRDPKIDRVVAIKTIIPVLANPEQERDFRKRFFREAQAAGKLSHPGIVTIFDVGEDEPTRTPFIVMEYISGRTLEDRLSAPAGQPPALETGLNWVKQVAEALDYAHSQGIVHRDVKPANIIITAKDQAKITDFGVAKLTESEFTVAGQILGTPAYMSPEQLSGRAVDGRSDLFSLGAILYWVLTAQKPFTGDTAAVMLQVVSQDPVPVSARNPTLSPDFDRVMERALAKDPALRYQRGEDLAADIEDLLKKRPPRNAAAEATVERTVIVTPSAGRSPTLRPQPMRRGWQTALVLFGGARRLLSRLSAKTRVAVAASTALLLLALLLRAGSRHAGSGPGPVGSGSPAVTSSSRPAVSPAQLASPGPQPATLPSPSPPRPSPPVSVRVRAHHNFRSAKLTIWADDKVVYQGRLIGVVRKKHFHTWVRGSFAKTISVPAGEHLIKVSVRSARDGYRDAAAIGGYLKSDLASTLIIAFGRNGELRLAWE